MQVGIDTDICHKVNCKHLNKEWALCKLPVNIKGYREEWRPGRYSYVPDDCHYRNIHILKGLEVLVDAYKIDSDGNIEAVMWDGSIIRG